MIKSTVRMMREFDKNKGNQVQQVDRISEMKKLLRPGTLTPEQQKKLQSLSRVDFVRAAHELGIH